MIIKKIKSTIQTIRNKNLNGGTSVGDMITLLIIIFFVSIILMVTVHSIVVINTKNKGNIIVKEYGFKIETKGYLTNIELESLKADLDEIGISNYTITCPNEITKKDYGEKFIISVEGTFKENNINPTTKIFSKIEYEFNTKYSSVAKN